MMRSQQEDSRGVWQSFGCHAFISSALIYGVNEVIAKTQGSVNKRVLQYVLEEHRITKLLSIST